ncbi:MAG TPA: isoprenylcysteine carboxylmethyltransferase family protein [Vicinamibacterales bacterium]|nr:isoprenylcysteine carboxylmethyltransferase family protein [Vicinamibacterales bacterium]
MADDQTFRTILIIGAVFLFPVAIFHRIRSQSTGESLDRWQEGHLILFTLRPIGIATMLGLLAYMIDPEWMAWSSMTLPTWLRWVGVVLGAAGGALVVWTFRHLGRNLTDTVVTRREHTLVLKGPYRFVRHPFYDAVALSIVGNALTAANWFLLAGGLLALALIVLRTGREEERLIARFGDAYRSYMDRTGRFLPRLRRHLDCDTIVRWPPQLSAGGRDGSEKNGRSPH